MQAQSTEDPTTTSRDRFRMVKQRLATLVARYHLLKHPFYQAWTAGELTRENLCDYTKQYYQQEVSFPTYLAGIYLQCERVEDRRQVLENLVEEDHGADNHGELLLRFAEGLGLCRQEVVEARPLPETVETVETFKRLSQRGSAAEGMAAIYAYEAMIPEVAESKLAGLRERYGIDDERTLSFFTVHEQADRRHRQWDLELLERLIADDETADRAVSAAEEAHRAMWSFLDGVQRAYLPEAMAS